MRFTKPYVLIMALLLIGLIITGCTNPFAGKDKAASTGNQTGKSSQTQTVKHDKTQEYRIEGIDLDIGSSYNDVIDNMGEPKEKSNYEGGLYLAYGDITFFTEGVDNNAKVSSIAIFGNRKIGIVKVGMAQTEVKNIMGKPFSEGEDEESGWVTTYTVGNRSMSFFSETKDSKVTSIFIKNEN
ncbi:MAG: DUF4309 domain-containing protein [Acidobacteriota bacterium]